MTDLRDQPDGTATPPDAGTAQLSPAWAAGRGPLAFLPLLLFRDRRAWLAIPVAWALTFAGSLLLGWTIARLVPGGAGPDMGDAPAGVKFVGIALLSPVVETMLMAGILALLTRWLANWQAAVASAAIWGVLHSLMAPLWGAVIWWPFLIFSTLYLTWRPRGWWTAVAVAASVHALQNVGPAALIAFG